MGRVVPQQLQSLLAVAGDDGHPGIAVDGAVEIPELAVDRDGDRVPGKLLADALCEGETGHGRVEFARRAIGQGQDGHREWSGIRKKGTEV